MSLSPARLRRGVRDLAAGGELVVDGTGGDVGVADVVAQLLVAEGALDVGAGARGCGGGLVLRVRSSVPILSVGGVSVFLSLRSRRSHATVRRRSARPFELNAASNTSSIESTRTKRSASRVSDGSSSRSCSFSRGRITRPRPGALRGEHLVAHAADRQHLAGQRDLARSSRRRRRPASRARARRSPSPSRSRPTGRPSAPRRPERGDGRRGARTSARRGSSSPVCERTHDSAACADSCITSPSCPVTVSLPRPGYACASM